MALASHALLVMSSRVVYCILNAGGRAGSPIDLLMYEILLYVEDLRHSTFQTQPLFKQAAQFGSASAQLRGPH